VPGTLGATRTGARDAASALQTLPDPTLRWLAAGSVGLSAGLFLTGKPRLIIAAGIAPALAMGAAIVARSAQPVIQGVAIPLTALEPRGDAPRRVGVDLTRRTRGVKRG
jgi:hypothetical protein